jgi:hypothetical protein
MSSFQQFPVCGHCNARNHFGGKNACPSTGRHLGAGPGRNCGTCVRLGFVQPQQQQQQQQAPRSVQQPQRQQQQWVEQTAVWVVQVPVNSHNHRVVFDATVPRFAELRQQFALVTMSSVLAEPIIDGVTTTTGSIMLSFATDRVLNRTRSDIMGRDNYLRVAGNSPQSQTVTANLGGMHASRHVDTASRAGSPGLVLDWDSNITVACAVRIAARVRCVGPLSGVVSGIPQGPVTVQFPDQGGHRAVLSVNVVGLVRLVITAPNVVLSSSAGNLRVGPNSSTGTQLNINGEPATTANSPGLAALCGNLNPGVFVLGR